MGKSVVDLPDPLEHGGPEPLTSAAPAGVDDLLAQMAGDEIDRLLAEADNPRETPVESPTPPKAGAPPAAPTPVAAVVKEVPAVQVEAAAPATEEAEDDGATSVAERSALEIPETVETPVAPVEPLFTEEETSASMAEDGALPFYLKPLAWLNAPMEALPEGIRDAVGKIALLTLFNAVAVLIYVLVFRRHR